MKEAQLESGISQELALQVSLPLSPLPVCGGWKLPVAPSEKPTLDLSLEIEVLFNQDSSSPK